jgi:pyocin large subunit-like protein
MGAMILRRAGLTPGGLPWRRLLTAALAAAALFAYWTHIADRGERHVVRERPAEARDEAAPRGWGTAVGFVSERRLEEHYQKHGGEFGRITRPDYLHQAQLLRDAEVGGPVLETRRADGVVTRFDRQTGAFIAFNRDGTIRTFFKPNDGERYYRRQAERVGE